MHMSHYLAGMVISLKIQAVVCWEVWTQSKEETHKLLGARTKSRQAFSNHQDTTVTKNL